MKVNSTWEGFVKGISANDNAKSGEQIEIMGMMGMCDPWSTWRIMN